VKMHHDLQVVEESLREMGDNSPVDTSESELVDEARRCVSDGIEHLKEIINA